MCRGTSPLFYRTCQISGFTVESLRRSTVNYVTAGISYKEYVSLPQLRITTRIKTGGQHVLRCGMHLGRQPGFPGLHQRSGNFPHRHGDIQSRDSACCRGTCTARTSSGATQFARFSTRFFMFDLPAFSIDAGALTRHRPGCRPPTIGLRARHRRLRRPPAGRFTAPWVMKSLTLVVAAGMEIILGYALTARSQQAAAPGRFRLVGALAPGRTTPA